ncbi:MAG: galactose mutarotase [Oscillospiraceae bacterium]|nr:galactose mutarotase [Oscillospiraceae bacterium]
MITKTEWGFADGYKVYLVTLKNKNGASVSLTNYGAAITSLCVPDKNGGFTDVMLGYDDLEGYINGSSGQGASIGRYANRIGGAKFSLCGTEYNLYKNDGENCLHGGKVGYAKRVWELCSSSDSDSPSAAFSYVSPDGEGNFPAKVKIIIRYTLTQANSLKIEYWAVPDGDTVINLTNHSYFNLGGYASGDVLTTELKIFADSYTPVDDALIPTGEIAPVSGTPLDFTKAKLIGDDIGKLLGTIGGYDHNFVLGEPGIWRKAAIAYNKSTGIEMTTYTDMPAMQLYTAIHLNEPGKAGSFMHKFCGFCLETQFTPNTPNLPNFPQCTFKKGEEFKFATEYAFGVRYV